MVVLHEPPLQFTVANVRMEPTSLTWLMAPMYPAGAITMMAIWLPRPSGLHSRPGIGYRRSVSLNVVHLIGLVAARPAISEGERTCTVLVVTSSPNGADRQRHRVLVHGAVVGTATDLSVGELVFIAGRLGRDQRHRVITVARELWPVTDALLDVRAPGPTDGHHASPREHRRVGHWRRINIGTSRERLCWVRATVVRGIPPTGSPSG